MTPLTGGGAGATPRLGAAAAPTLLDSHIHRMIDDYEDTHPDGLHLVDTWIAEDFGDPSTSDAMPAGWVVYVLALTVLSVACWWAVGRFLLGLAP